jgi:hypothetical protein
MLSSISAARRIAVIFLMDEQPSFQVLRLEHISAM